MVEKRKTDLSARERQCVQNTLVAEPHTAEVRWRWIELGSFVFAFVDLGSCV